MVRLKQCGGWVRVKKGKSTTSRTGCIEKPSETIYQPCQCGTKISLLREKKASRRKVVIAVDYPRPPVQVGGSGGVRRVELWSMLSSDWESESVDSVSNSGSPSNDEGWGVVLDLRPGSGWRHQISWKTWIGCPLWYLKSPRAIVSDTFLKMLLC